MRAFTLTIFILFLQSILLGQALLKPDYSMVDNTMSFFNNHYDTALLRKSNVVSCQQQNLTFYFDSSGRVEKSVFIPQDGATELRLYRYDARGDLVAEEMSSPKYPKTILNTNYKTYKSGLLVKDSSSSGYICKHLDYYPDGSLRQEIWYGSNHTLQRGFWFGVDSLARFTRVIDRGYSNSSDSIGQLISNRTLFYNEMGQLIKEEEAVPWEENKTKSLFCPNAGSASFIYDGRGRLVEIIRTKGPSQKIKYLENGLIAEIETTGKNCEGIPFHWKLPYIYTYRK